MINHHIRTLEAQGHNATDAANVGADQSANVYFNRSILVIRDMCLILRII